MLRQAGRDLRHDLAARVTRHEIVEDVAVDAVAVGIPLQVRIERRRIVRRIDGEDFLCRLRRHRRRQQ